MADNGDELVEAFRRLPPGHQRIALKLVELIGDVHEQLLDDISALVPAPHKDRPYQGRQLQPHRTWAAYKRHLRRGEEPCPPCREAARERERSRNRNRGAA